MEVESLLEPGIAEIEHVVVTARQEETIRGKTLVACCQLKPGTTIDTSEIRSRCFAVMPRHMVPDEVLVIKEIPRLPNGKFDRKKITDTLNLKN
jgi:acyl-CoA synthetase (AMP-forming)/AMP-acid ligase II